MIEYPADLVIDIVNSNICPPCEKGEHWNHREEDGSCSTTENIHLLPCICDYREVSR